MGEPEPTLAVGAVVLHSGRLLLVRRGREPGAGLWSLPGGRLEPGESLAASVSREVAEETGIEVEAGDLVGFVERRGEGYWFLILDFLATPVGGELEPRPGDDAVEAAWIELEALGGLALVEGLADFLAEHGVT